MEHREMSALEFETITALAEIVSYNPESALGKAKIGAIKNAIERANYYKSQMFDDTFIVPALKKRMEYIRNAKTVAEITEILKSPNPTYNGNEFVNANQFEIAEEEMMCWSLASLKAPLSQEACNRYFKLFENVTGINPREM